MTALTTAQERELERLDAANPARVIGWDTGAHGPLVEVFYDTDGDGNYTTFAHFAISPRGRQIDRTDKAESPMRRLERRLEGAS